VRVPRASHASHAAHTAHEEGWHLLEHFAVVGKEHER
jgi:hypothetical protein